MLHDLRSARRTDLEIAEESRLNPIWIEGLPSRETALEISVPYLPLRRALEAVFQRVEDLPASSGDVSGAGFGIPFPDHSFDLVTLYGGRPSSTSLWEVQRVLRPGGTFFLAVRNRWWYGRLRGADPDCGSGWCFGGPRLAKRVLGSGFSSVREYYLDPSLQTPRDTIAAHPASLRAHEAVRRKEMELGTLSLALGRLGLAGVLYAGRLIIARA